MNALGRLERDHPADFKDRDVPGEERGSERKSEREGEEGREGGREERGWKWVTDTAVDASWPEQHFARDRLQKGKEKRKKKKREVICNEEPNEGR